MDNMENVNLKELSNEELIGLNQEAGKEIDALREFRRQINAEYDLRVQGDELRAKYGDHLTDEDVKSINAIVSVKKLTAAAEVKNG